MIDIKDISGKVLKSVLETSDCRINEELMSLCFISLSWDDDNDMTLPEGSYIERNGEKYQLLEPYNPSFISENAFRYTPVFYDRIALWSKKPCFLVTDSGEETDWSMTAYPGQFMDVIIRALSKYVGETYTYSVDASIAQSTMEYITFQNTSIFDGLTKIANAWDTEWWVSGNVIHLSKCQYGTAVTLTVGDNVGIPSVTKNKEGYFTRFYAFGGTRNITQDYNDSGFTNGLVNKRLTLDPTDYPGGYIDIKPNLQQAEIFVKTLIFDEIYPSSILTISNVRAELKDLLDESGNKIQVAEDAEGNPVYQQYSIWYFKIPGFTLDNSTYDKEDNPDGMLLPGLALSVSFESGQLNGRDFELTYHGDTQEYEINFIKEGTLIVPGTVSLIPADGDKIILYNIKMPDEYMSSAQDDLAEALLSEIEKYKQDRDSYTFPSVSDKFEEDGLDMSVGQAVTFVHGDKSLPSRVLKVEKQLDFPIEQTITVGEEKIKGNTQEIKEEVIDANQNIDVVKTLADLNKAITDGYGRVQQLIIQSMSQYKGMWVLNQNGHPDDPSYWTVETDYTAISRGDIVAKSVEEEIEDAELPKAGYGITNFGLTAIKQGGGLMIDSNNLVYVDPAYAGGGGIDIEQLEEYLTGNNYLQKNDPVSSLLMTGYSKYSTNSAIVATDTALTAISKLERKFDYYVTLDTTQTITGSKTFAQDIVGQRDIICKSTSEAIADAELPIASSTQLGLIKVGSGFEITADGTLNNTGGGGLTEVYWTDIKNPPTTLAGYGIKASDVLTTLKTVDGSGSGLDADLLDGQHERAFALAYNSGHVTLESRPFRGLGYAYEADGWPYTGPMIAFGVSNSYSKYIMGRYNDNTIYLASNNNGVLSSWREFAFTDSNVASASKLSPGCKIWGQTFTGEKDITGSLLDVDSITSRSNNFILRVENDQQILASNSLNNTLLNARKGGSLYLGYQSTDSIYFHGGQSSENTTGSRLGHWSIDGLCIGGASHGAKLHVIGDGLFTGDVIARSTSTAISDAELPIASANTLGLIKVGSGLKITNGVLSVTASGGGSNVYWGSPTDDMVPLYVDDSYYELSRKKHKHAVSTNGTGNAVTSISFNKDTGGMILSKGSTFSLNGHTHSQYLTSHQTIYKLTIQKNGTTVGTYTPNSANKTINITVDDATADPFNGGTITNALYINIPRGGATRAFKMRYGTGKYFIINNGGTPALMANNADSYNSNANVTFDTSKVSAVGFTYTGTSDMRLKDKIGDITGVLDKLSGIEAFFFRYKADPNDIHIGVSAQEVIKVFPEVVPLIGDYYQLRYTDFLTAVSVNGIKELYALQKQTTNEIDVLKQRIALLEAENQNLWNIINEKEAA